MKKGLYLQLIPFLLVLTLSSVHFSIAGTNPSSYQGKGDNFLSRIGVYISGAGFDEGGVEMPHMIHPLSECFPQIMILVTLIS